MTGTKPEEEKAFFGAESYYRWLKAGVSAGDMAVMEKMIEDVNAYARPQICLRFSKKEDIEDILQELDLALWKQIAKYVRDSDEYHPFQRQSWLKKLISGVIANYQRAAGHPAGSLEEEFEKSGLEPDDGGRMEFEVYDRMCNETLAQIILDISSMRISAEKMLTFFYHNIVFFLEGGSRRNGKPQETIRRLRGKTLGQLREELPQAIRQAAGCEVDEKLFRKLDERLRGHEDDVYRLTPDEVSVTISNSRKRLAERKAGKEAPKMEIDRKEKQIPEL